MGEEAIKYKQTQDECQQKIDKFGGVCEGCGGMLGPIKTVDNGGSPTYWVGCLHCSCFRGGVDEKYFKIARKLVESGELIPYEHMNKCEYEDSEERLDYFYDSQTTKASSIVRRVAFLLKEAESGA